MAVKPKKITDSEIKKLSPTWSIKKKHLYKRFVFSNFSDAVGFIIQVSLEAEKMNHHPTIHNTYNRVEFILSTHSANGITKLDTKLADAIDDI